MTMKLPLVIQRQLNKRKSPLKTYWMVERISGKENFGDMITPFILEKIFGYKTEWTPVKRCDLACVGSILGVLQDHSKGKRIKVWGSGFIQDGPNNNNEDLDFYAVRGPLTLKRIHANRHVALGDPGLLANLVFKKSPRKTHKIGVVAHYVDLESPILKKIKDNRDILVISPLQDPQKVASDITSCEIIFSSSLHGLIFADSFSVPNYWLPLSKKVIGGSYKFTDYCMVTQRELVKKLPSILFNDDEIEDAIKSYKPVRNLNKIQRDLIRNFPY